MTHYRHHHHRHVNRWRIVLNGILYMSIVLGAIAWVFLLGRCASSTSCVRPGARLTPAVDVSLVKLYWSEQFGPIDASKCGSVDFIATSIGCDGAAGCFYTQGCPYISVAPAFATERRLAVHELSHWLLWCTTGDSDHEHRDPLVWAAGGFVDSVGGMHDGR